MLFSGERFTDRDRGKWFVLSAHRAASRAAESEYIVAHCIYTTGDRCMECQLFGMCQNITHVYKQIVN